ncbi:MAG: hypothetical protein JSS27_09060 [Planctomycetes bacterium]|nr:hypothetical protein [Planctomycetota bacterium]
MAVREKSLPVAIGLNFVLVGLGYFYMDRPFSGIGCLLIAIYTYAGYGLYGLLGSWLSLNLVMLIDMLILRSINKQEVAAATTKKCPNCAETIKLEARVCRYCQTKLFSSNAEQVDMSAIASFNKGQQSPTASIDDLVGDWEPEAEAKTEPLATPAPVSVSPPSEADRYLAHAKDVLQTDPKRAALVCRTIIKRWPDTTASKNATRLLEEKLS